MTCDGTDDGAANKARRARTVLAALAAMARRSTRAQADLCAALYRSGLSLPEPEQATILGDLAAAGLIENLIPLTDGSVLLTVTTQGLVTSGKGR